MRVSLLSCSPLRLTAAATLFGAASTLLQAQTARDSTAVKQTALDYLEGFYQGDTARLVRAIRPDVYKYGFFVSRGATRYEGEQMKWAEFLTYANDVKKSGKTVSATAPRKVEILDLLDQTASLKVTAYWGTDYLLMGLYDGRWMISHVLWQSPVRK